MNRLLRWLFCRRGWHSWWTDPLAFGDGYYANLCEWCSEQRYTDRPLQGWGFRHSSWKP